MSTPPSSRETSSRPADRGVPGRPGRCCRTLAPGARPCASNFHLPRLSKKSMDEPVVAWRGSIKLVEFLKDSQCSYSSAEKVLGPSSENFKNAKVHRGFLSVYTAAPRSIENHLLLQETTDISVVMTSVREQVNYQFPESYS
ncbi:hypothetical protein ACQ4PT_012325 [Festuca glaucescens]